MSVIHARFTNACPSTGLPVKKINANEYNPPFPIFGSSLVIIKITKSDSPSIKNLRTGSTAYEATGATSSSANTIAILRIESRRQYP